jgi:hypothetical protein
LFTASDGYSWAEGFTLWNQEAIFCIYEIKVELAMRIKSHDNLYFGKNTIMQGQKKSIDLL